ncbi:MAG: hypothetical protein K8T20_20540 [Planctomycetes bacterium]|nr:hypothetical protein [Planctomycetota bacterium]
MRRALIVHDNPEIRDSVAAALRATGFEVQSVPATPTPGPAVTAGPWDAVVGAGPFETRPEGWSLRAARRGWELRFIEKAMAEHGGDKARTARALGINLSSLYRKLTGDDAAESPDAAPSARSDPASGR